MNLENMYEGKDINILIEGKELKNYIIKEFLLEEKMSEHHMFTMQIETDIIQKKMMEEIISKEDVEIKIILLGVLGKRKIFEGIIDYFEVLDYGSDGSRILLKAFSKSILFDRKQEKKYRVFQDINFTYENIIEEINKEYVEKKIEIKYSDIAKNKINSLVIQYDETDWEFLVRLSSHLKTGIFITEQGVITFGVIETNETKEENRYFSNYSIVKDYRNLYYKIYSDKVISLGDTVLIKNNINETKEENEKNTENTFVVLSSKIVLKNYVLKSEFLATNIENYNIYKKYNSKIQGNTIEVKVEKVFDDEGIAKMEVVFGEGLNKISVKKRENNGDESKAYDDYGIKRFPLSYQTFYSQTNTGFFCTPEVNDTVEVYFPNEDETFAKVSWAINNKGNGRFSNYEKRNFHINGKDFNLRIDKDTLSVDIAKSYTRNSKTSTETADSFINKGIKNMVVISENYMGIESRGEVSMFGNNVDIIGKEDNITMESPNEVRIKGKKVHNN